MSFQEIIGIFSYPFVQRALLVGVVISFCAALLGVVLVLKRYSLIGHGLSNVGFASVALALAFQLPTLPVSIPIVIVASFLIMMISQKKSSNGDVVIGIVATASLALGVVIMSWSGGFNVDVSNYMFGSILAINRQDVILSMALGIVVIALFVLFYNRLFLITYDENYAKATGVNVTFYQFLISFLTALTVVVGMRMMGTLLISGLIIFPAVTAKRLVNSFRGLVITAGLISVLCLVVGILVSFIFNIPTGASIVVVNVCAMIVVSLISKFTNK